MSDALPSGWENAKIGTLCDLVNGMAFKPTDWSETGLPIIRIQNLNNPNAQYNRFDGEVSHKHLVANGDLLFAWSGTPGTSFGAHIWNGEPAVLNQHIFNVLFDRNLISQDFFRLAINFKLEELIDKAHGGVGLRHVTKGKFEETEITLPPFAEQHRIVEKIDSLFTRSTRARDELAHIPRLIERYRQAVLEAAFRGDLTADWRGDAQGDELPHSWRMVDAVELFEEGPTNGYSPKAAADGQGTKSLKLSATTTGSFILNDQTIKRLLENVGPDARCWLRPNDILIQRANSLEYVGATAIFDGPRNQYIYPDLMMRVRIPSPATRMLFWYYMNSDIARGWLRDRPPPIFLPIAAH